MSTEPTNVVLRLDGIEQAARDTKIFRFTAANGAILPPASPGAHIDLDIAPGLTRQYSLVELDPTGRSYSIAVQCLPDGRGGSRTLHAQAAIGAEYSARATRNTFPVSTTKAESVLFAGGIGVTPLLTHYHALRARAEPVRLVYWARTSDAFLYTDTLAADPNVTLYATGEKAAPRLEDLLPGIAPTTELYCCGPLRMLEAFDLATADRPAERLHTEYFEAPATPAGTPSAPFSVTLARQNRTLEIGATETILDACLAAGIDVPYSCEEGVCGACQVRVLAGRVDHRDTVWPAATHEREGTMIICCSRAADDSLVLDI
ncbi:PDR/VanB family oxidoreductase [Acetobacter sp.]|uniref:PDR/VanB family oxidoreductase n=1 Tax=Acetobacter sp. TaxID=440 RepID=UPI0039EC391F